MGGEDGGGLVGLGRDQRFDCLSGICPRVAGGATTPTPATVTTPSVSVAFRRLAASADFHSRAVGGFSAATRRRSASAAARCLATSLRVGRGGGCAAALTFG